MMEIIKEEIEERRMIRDVEEAGGIMYVLIMMEIIKEEMEERRMIREVEEAGGVMCVFKKFFLKYMFCVG